MYIYNISFDKLDNNIIIFYIKFIFYIYIYKYIIFIFYIYIYLHFIYLLYIYIYICIFYIYITSFMNFIWNILLPDQKFEFYEFIRNSFWQTKFSSFTNLFWVLILPHHMDNELYRFILNFFFGTVPFHVFRVLRVFFKHFSAGLKFRVLRVYLKLFCGPYLFMYFEFYDYNILNNIIHNTYIYIYIYLRIYLYL